ncbi:MAG: N-acetylmuramoyl-L-alanine amidase [Bacillota bacterium]|nr:N-acetylmuramoyl-L-alanine amidase [Bacillota bacterium]
MRIRIRNKKSFISAMILMFLLMIAVFRGNALFKGNTSSSQAVGQVSYSVTSKDKIKGKALDLSASGNVFLEENSHFRKYLIKLGESKDGYKGFKENNGSIFLDLKNPAEVSLNSGSFKESDKNLMLTDVDGKQTLVVEEAFKDNNFVFLDELNNSLIILTSKEAEPLKYTVVLDPGHGGVDPGASAYDKSFDEKEVTLKIQKLVRPELIFNGCRVFMSRETDKTIRIEDVVAFAEEKKADVFVSVHINFYDKSNVYSGIQTHYSKFSVKSSESKKLAEIVEKNAVKSDGWKNRGTTFASTEKSDLYVVHHTTMPGVLVECGFASNPADVNRLNDNNTLHNLSENISGGILEYLNSK